MVQAVKTIASRVAQIASVPASTLRQFPPREAILNSTTHDAFFSPETWAKLQHAPPTALTAFAHRIGLGRILTRPEEIRLVLTHDSFPSFYATHRPKEPRLTSNANLATLGNSLLGLFATEYLHASYPHLPTRVLKAAVSAYVGPQTCAVIAKEMGVPPLIRWHFSDLPQGRPQPVTLTDALATVPRALTALVYQHRSLPTARKFAQSYFLSREIDLRPFMKFRDPKMALSRTVSKFQRERPISRILKETGRRSNSPIFVVGIFSGQDKLGEGFGSSLKMAEYRAAEDSLHRLYLTCTPDELLQLPTNTFADKGSIFAPGVDDNYTAPDIGESEVVYASRDR